MYFTNKMQKNILRKIKTGNYNLYAIKLYIGIHDTDPVELEQLVNLMFIA